MCTNNKMITIEIKGELFEVIEETKAVCSRCGQPTYCESYDVYGDDPYAMEICSNEDCGWWANSVMNSDDMKDDINSVVQECAVEHEAPSKGSDFEDMVEALYAQMYYNTYGFIYDPDSDPVKGHILKEAFNKTCYDFDVQHKSFNEEVITDEKYLTITNYCMTAVIPVDDVNAEIFSETITDYQHTCPTHLSEIN